LTEIFPKYAVKACDSRADCVRLGGLIDSKILISTIGLLYLYTEEREIKLNFTMNENILFYPCTEYICLCA
jgi:hypothetical protein